LNLLRDSCAENIEHGRLAAAMQPSTITRNNVAPVAQETGRRRESRRARNIATELANIKRLTLTQATAVTAIFPTA